MEILLYIFFMTNGFAMGTVATAMLFSYWRMKDETKRQRFAAVNNSDSNERFGLLIQNWRENAVILQRESEKWNEHADSHRARVYLDEAMTLLKYANEVEAILKANDAGKTP